MPSTTNHRLLAPTIGTGVLMAIYLLARPYGDVTESGMAQAFSSTAWIVAHVCGALAIASIGRLTLRLSDATDARAARIARWTGLAGAMLVLPYYGAEAFGLHAVGTRALTDPTTLELVDQIRNQPAAMTMFGIGLVLLMVASLAFGVAASRLLTLRPTWAAWPLAIAITVFPAQFFVPPSGRIAFGIAYALAAALFAVTTLRPVSDREPALQAGLS